MDLATASASCDGFCVAHGAPHSESTYGSTAHVHENLQTFTGDRRSPTKAFGLLSVDGTFTLPIEDKYLVLCAQRYLCTLRGDVS